MIFSEIFIRNLIYNIRKSFEKYGKIWQNPTSQTVTFLSRQCHRFNFSPILNHLQLTHCATKLKPYLHDSTAQL